MEKKQNPSSYLCSHRYSLENISILEFMECHYRKIICARPNSFIENNYRIIWIVIKKKKNNFYVTKISLSSNQLSLFWKDHSSGNLLAAEGGFLASSDIIFSWIWSLHSCCCFCWGLSGFSFPWCSGFLICFLFIWFCLFLCLCQMK